ncbi:MAG: hypothetical protein R3335_03675 [Anaerolineales bacterium]|nr:hypothetical protein [Anaerolineales bacterium]
MENHKLRSGDSIIIEALGQTWYFTPEVVRMLKLTGLDPEDTMKTIIMSHGSKKGFEDGVYEVESFGLPLQLTVKDTSVIVDDPYAW